MEVGGGRREVVAPPSHASEQGLKPAAGIPPCNTAWFVAGAQGAGGLSTRPFSPHQLRRGQLLHGVVVHAPAGQQPRQLHLRQGEGRAGWDDDWWGSSDSLCCSESPSQANWCSGRSWWPAVPPAATVPPQHAPCSPCLPMPHLVLLRPELVDEALRDVALHGAGHCSRQGLFWV